jgi:hypothetical protein
VIIPPIKVDLNAGSKKAKNGIANMKIDIEEYGKFNYIYFKIGLFLPLFIY